MKEASWKVLVQTYLKAFFLSSLLFCLCWACCRWAGGYVPAARSLRWAALRVGASELSLTWWSRKWAEKTNAGLGVRLIPELLSFICAGPDSVWHGLCLWLVQKFQTSSLGVHGCCHRCPSGGRSGFLVFSSPPCFMGKNGCCHLALTGWGRAVQPFQIQKTDVCWDSRSSGLHACCWFTVTQRKAQLVRGQVFPIFSCPSFLCMGCNRQVGVAEPQLFVWHLLSTSADLKALSSPVYIFIIHLMKLRHIQCNVSSEIARRKSLVSWLGVFCSACKAFFYSGKITNHLAVQLESILWLILCCLFIGAPTTMK